MNQTRCKFFWLFVLATLSLASNNLLLSQEKEFTFEHENVLGTSFSLRIGCETAEQAKKMEEAVLAEIDRLDSIFSEYKRSSEFVKWMESNNESVVVSDELFSCLQEASRYQALTDGAFHPGAGVFSRRWKGGEKADVRPSNSDLAADLKLIGQPIWKLDSAKRAAMRLVDIPVSLNAIAKGFIIEAAGTKLMKSDHSPSSLSLNIGGDMRVWGAVKTKVGIADPKSAAENSKPRQTIEISNLAIATSGNYQRKFSIKGKSYSHIIDPRSGLPTDYVASASVVAASATMADALATAFSVLKIEESIAIAEKQEGCECFIIDKNGKSFTSSGWKELVSSESESQVADTQTNELVIDFNIRKYGGGRYRRPYVAVWIETPNGIPVRTLSLWLMEKRPGPRWHRDLSRWYSGEQMRLLAEGKSHIGGMSQATRPPGKYKVVWDGKSDNGQTAVAGKYVAYIEAAREHGTYKLMKLEFEHGPTLFKEKLEDNAEIESASLTYRKSGK